MSRKRTSIYDIVKARLRMAQRVTYMHRIIYVGKHSFGEDPTVKQFFEGVIRKVNAQDFDEVLTGFLLCYQHLFVHIVEGSEAAILRHLRGVYEHVHGGETRLGTMRVLIVCHNIRKRFFKQWAGCTARPPTLLEETDPQWKVQTIWQLVRTCINKLYKLSAFLSQQSVVVLNTAMDHLLEKVPTQLPDITLLNFLLQCKALLDLQKYMNMHLTMSQVKYYHETVWPIQEELIPFHLADTGEYKFLCDMGVLTGVTPTPDKPQ